MSDPRLAACVPCCTKSLLDLHPSKYPGLSPNSVTGLPAVLAPIFKRSPTFAPERNAIASEQEFRSAVFAVLEASVQGFADGKAGTSQPDPHTYEASCYALRTLASPSLTPAVSDRARTAAGLIPALLASVDRLLAEPPPEARVGRGPEVRAEGLWSALALMAALFTHARQQRAMLDPAMTKSLMACVRRGAAVSVRWLEEEAEGTRARDPGRQKQPLSQLLCLLEAMDLEGIQPGAKGTALDASRPKQLLEILRTVEGLVRMAALLPARLQSGSSHAALPTELLDWSTGVMHLMPLSLPQGLSSREVHPVAQEAMAGLVESTAKFALRWTGRGLSEFQHEKERFFCSVINVAGTATMFLSIGQQIRNKDLDISTPEPMLRCVHELLDSRAGFRGIPDGLLTHHAPPAQAVARCGPGGVARGHGIEGSWAPGAAWKVCIPAHCLSDLEGRTVGDAVPNGGRPRRTGTSLQRCAGEPSMQSIPPAQKKARMLTEGTLPSHL